MLLTVTVPELMTTTVPVPLVITTSSTGPGTCPPLQLDASLQEVGSLLPPPTHEISCPKAGIAAERKRAAARILRLFFIVFLCWLSLADRGRFLGTRPIRQLLPLRPRRAGQFRKSCSSWFWSGFISSKSVHLIVHAPKSERKYGLRPLALLGGRPVRKGHPFGHHAGSPQPQARTRSAKTFESPFPTPRSHTGLLAANESPFLSRIGLMAF